MRERPLKIDVDAKREVSALLLEPASPGACYVFAHGAGAGMTHPFMEKVAHGLAERSVATLRFQFPSMEAGARRPDPPAVAEATVRAAVSEAARALPGLRLFAGGKSFGGRMSSQAQAAEPLAGVHGLVFVGFPLHPPGNPSQERARHLDDVRIPMLFLQGTRDALAQMPLVEAVVERLGKRATLRRFEDADHSFHVPARAARDDAAVIAELCDAIRDWAAAIA